MKCRIERGEAAGRACVIALPEGKMDVRALIVCHVGPEAEALFAEVLRALPKACPPVALAAVTDVSWDADYTPWPSDCLPGRRFSGGADAYLRAVEEVLLPWAQLHARAEAVYSLGYSLGGLCALYALTRSGRYAGGASVSGALWYPGFQAYFQAHRPDAPVYCSLGRAESRTRNPAMCMGAQCAQEIASRPGDRFEWTNGNHFFEIPQRIARAVSSMLDDVGAR